jgi:hypothetical protein
MQLFHEYSLETITSLWVIHASLVSKTKGYRSRWASVDLQKLNIMLQSCSSRCWVFWMWYKYKPSKFIARQIDVCGTPTHEETLLIFQYRVCFAMARMFLSCLWGCDNKGVKEDYQFPSGIHELPWTGLTFIYYSEKLIYTQCNKIKPTDNVNHDCVHISIDLNHWWYTVYIVFM